MPKGISKPPLGTPKRCTNGHCSKPRTASDHTIQKGGTVVPVCPSCFNSAVQAAAR